MEDSNIEPGKYKPRFNFEKDQLTDQSATGSINELLEELNRTPPHKPKGSQKSNPAIYREEITKENLE
ncbi:TPA: hypothetical protein ACOEBF_001134, partial [Stenotrophomonas maltophilia]